MDCISIFYSVEDILFVWLAHTLNVHILLLCLQDGILRFPFTHFLHRKRCHSSANLMQETAFVLEHKNCLISYHVKEDLTKNTKKDVIQ